jgi:hypothetical protein
MCGKGLHLCSGIYLFVVETIIFSLIRFDVRANLDYMPEYKNSEKTEEMDYKVRYR